MGNPHGINRHILYNKAFIRFYRLEQTVIYRSEASASPDGIQSFRSRIYGNVVFAGKHAQTADVVTMFMSHENRIQLTGTYSQAVQPFLRPLSADSHIHQNMCGIRPYINAVSAAAAGNAAQSHNLFNSLSFALSILYPCTNMPYPDHSCKGKKPSM